MTQAQRIARFVEYGLIVAVLAFFALIVPREVRAVLGMALIVIGMLQMALAPPGARYMHRRHAVHVESEAWMAGGEKGTTRYLTARGGIFVAMGLAMIVSLMFG